jgi:hypothetical protein
MKLSIDDNADDYDDICGEFLTSITFSPHIYRKTSFLL